MRRTPNRRTPYKPQGMYDLRYGFNPNRCDHSQGRCTRRPLFTILGRPFLGSCIPRPRALWDR